MSVDLLLLALIVAGDGALLLLGAGSALSIVVFFLCCARCGCFGMYEASIVDTKEWRVLEASLASWGVCDVFHWRSGYAINGVHVTSIGKHFSFRPMRVNYYAWTMPDRCISMESPRFF